VRARRLRGAKPRWVERPVASDFATDAELAEWEASGDPINPAMTSLRRYHIALQLAYRDLDAPADHSAGWPRLAREPDGSFARPEGGPPASLVAAVLAEEEAQRAQIAQLTGRSVPPR